MPSKFERLDDALPFRSGDFSSRLWGIAATTFSGEASLTAMARSAAVTVVPVAPGIVALRRSEGDWLWDKAVVHDHPP